MQRLTEQGLTAMLTVAIVACGSPWGIGDVLLAVMSTCMFGLLVAAQAGAGAARWGPYEWTFLLVLAGLAITQLLPLPQGFWGMLAGRDEVLRDLATAGIAGAWRPLGMDPGGAFRALAGLLPALVFLLGVRRLPSDGVARMAHWLVMLASLSAVLGIAQVAGGPETALRLHDFHNREGALGFFANRNHQAALLYMALPIAFAFTTHAVTGPVPSRAQQVRRFMAVLALPVLLLGLALTTSRAGIGLGLVALLGSVALVFSQRHPRGRGLLVLALVVVAGLVLALLQAIPALSQRLQQDVLGDSRWWLFASTWDLRPAHGWWGSGLGSFEEVFRKLPENQRVVGAYVNHAHNDWLELWLELGWLFPVLALAACTAFGRACWHAWRDRACDSRVVFARAAACSTGLVAIHSLVDWPLRTGANMAVFSLLAAILLRCGQAGEAHGRRHPRRGRSSAGGIATTDNQESTGFQEGDACASQFSARVT